MDRESDVIHNPAHMCQEAPESRERVSGEYMLFLDLDQAPEVREEKGRVNDVHLPMSGMISMQ